MVSYNHASFWSGKFMDVFWQLLCFTLKEKKSAHVMDFEI